MTRKGLGRLRREMERCRQAQIKSVELKKIAKGLGRVVANRGKEPTFISTPFPQLRPLSIPSHGGRDLPFGTKRSILNQLEDDLAEWDVILP